MRRLELVGYGMLTCALLVAEGNPATAGPEKTYGVPLVVTSELPFPNVPMDPMIDFTSLISKAGPPGSSTRTRFEWST